MEALANQAVKDRRVREAAEAGRRQKEEMKYPTMVSAPERKEDGESKAPDGPAAESKGD